MHWIIQKNFNNYFEQWTRVLENLNQKYTAIEIVPFSDELPIVNIKEKCFAYGTTSIIKNAKKQWNPGVFFNQDNFKVSAWLPYFKKEMLNHDGYTCKLNELLTSGPDELFIRPNNVLKDFTGVLVKRSELIKQIENVNKGGFPFDGNTEVFVAKPKHIQKEWRFFVVDNEVITGCQYKLKSMALMDKNIPKDLEEYASKLANIWTPDKACVMDIAQDYEGNYKLLEFNCINASGLYVCNLEKIVTAIIKLINK